MLGHLLEWLYAGLAGIKQDEHSVAFQNSIIYPQPVGDVTHANATYQSPYGPIVSDWKKSDTSFDRSDSGQYHLNGLFTRVENQ